MTQITVDDNKKHIYALSDELTSPEIVFVASKQPAENTRSFDMTDHFPAKWAPRWGDKHPVDQNLSAESQVPNFAKIPTDKLRRFHKMQLQWFNSQQRDATGKQLGIKQEIHLESLHNKIFAFGEALDRH